MSYEVPDDLRYTETHEWIDASTGRVGITDYAQDELGDIVYVELPETGNEVDAGGEFGIIESIKAVSDLYIPVTGEVTDTNTEVHDAPELVNEDPYGDGWLIQVEIRDDAELEELLGAEEYLELIR